MYIAENTSMSSCFTLLMLKTSRMLSTRAFVGNLHYMTSGPL